jgi:hypothetical protein
MNRHQAIDRRDLELCREAARLVDGNPALLARVRDAVRRGLAIHAADPRSLPAVREWDELLSRPWPEIRQALLEEGEEGTRRRQSSPFPCLLPKEARQRILDKHRAGRNDR